MPCSRPVAGASLAARAGALRRRQRPRQPPRAREADAHFRRGVELYKEADYPAALIEFRRAYELDPRYQALYNVGETYDQLQDYANALRTFEKYQRDGGAQISAGRRDEVQKEIDKLRTRVASVEVTINVLRRRDRRRRRARGQDPGWPAPLVVSAGRRKVTATCGGQAAGDLQFVDLAGGDVQEASRWPRRWTTPGLPTEPASRRARAASRWPRGSSPASPWRARW